MTANPCVPVLIGFAAHVARAMIPSIGIIGQQLIRKKARYNCNPSPLEYEPKSESGCFIKMRVYHSSWDSERRITYWNLKKTRVFVLVLLLDRSYGMVHAFWTRPCWIFSQVRRNLPDCFPFRCLPIWKRCKNSSRIYRMIWSAMRILKEMHTILALKWIVRAWSMITE